MGPVCHHQGMHMQPHVQERTQYKAGALLGVIWKAVDVAASRVVVMQRCALTELTNLCLQSHVKLRHESCLGNGIVLLSASGRCRFTAYTCILALPAGLEDTISEQGHEHSRQGLHCRPISLLASMCVSGQDAEQNDT